MASLRHRLEVLEARLTANSRREIPPEVRALFREVDRERARLEGRQVPGYTPEELEELHRSDCETAAGGGAVGYLRSDSTAWKSPEAQAELEAWQAEAQQRCARIEAGEPLAAVYNDAVAGELVNLFDDSDEYEWKET